MRYEDLTGQRFGRLVCVNITDKRNKSRAAYWNCLCDCGNYKLIGIRALKQGNTRSCGCLQIEIQKRRLSGNKIGRKTQGQSGFTQLYTGYKQNAKRKGNEFSLTKEQFRQLVTSNCFYCNRPPNQVRNPMGVTNISKDTLEHGKFIYNGIDRKDNSIGYIIDNVIPCCMRDNYIKGSKFTVEETKVMVEALEKFHNDNSKRTIK
jgi:hypothetical protein